MRFSVVVVHYRAPDDLRRCLRSVRRASENLSCETIIIDNASPDAEILAREFPDCVWAFNASNVGFGAAANQAAARARGEILVFLNQDAELEPEALERLAAFLRKNRLERLGPIGGKLLFPVGASQPSCGPFPSLASLLWRRALPPVRRKYYLREPGPGSRVDWVTGAFFAVPRAVFDDLKGFDASFFMYYEDVDFCLRAREKGYHAYYCPDAVSYHHRPHATRARDRALQRVIQDSRLRYFAKHRPSWETFALRQLHRLEAA